MFHFSECNDYLRHAPRCLTTNDSSRSQAVRRSSHSLEYVRRSLPQTAPPRWPDAHDGHSQRIRTHLAYGAHRFPAQRCPVTRPGSLRPFDSKMAELDEDAATGPADAKWSVEDVDTDSLGPPNDSPNEYSSPVSIQSPLSGEPPPTGSKTTGNAVRWSIVGRGAHAPCAETPSRGCELPRTQASWAKWHAESYVCPSVPQTGR